MKVFFKVIFLILGFSSVCSTLLADDEEIIPGSYTLKKGELLIEKVDLGFCTDSPDLPQKISVENLESVVVGYSNQEYEYVLNHKEVRVYKYIVFNSELVTLSEKVVKGKPYFRTKKYTAAKVYPRYILGPVNAALSEIAAKSCDQL